MDDAEIDAVCERIVNMSWTKDKVAFLLGMLERMTDERDRQRARVLELEGQVGDREQHLRDALKDMRTERDRLRERIATYEGSLEAWVGRAEEAEVERDRLRTVVDLVKEYRALHGQFWLLKNNEDEAVVAAERESYAWSEVVAALDQLDVSAEATDE